MSELNTIETPESAVGNLAMALGMWMATGMVSEEQKECFVESVCVLAVEADVEKALLAFDTPDVRKIAAECIRPRTP